MFTSVRSRIFAGFVLVALVMVSTTALLAAVPIRRFQERLESQRLQAYAATLAVGAGVILEQAPARPTAVDGFLARQAERLGARILIVDRSGTVVADSAPRQPLSPALDAAVRQAAGRVDGRRAEPLDAGLVDRQRLVVAPVPRSDGLTLALLAPARRAPIGRGLLLPLAAATGLGLLVALAVTWLVSRSIAGPITRLTQAADAMAAGNLEQAISGEGSDELGRLVRSFNTMASSLRAMLEIQRRLLANVAHELRTPLTVIQGYALALRERVLEDRGDRERALATIVEECERADRLLAQLLQLSRLESGLRRPALQPVRLQDLAGRVVERHRLAAEARGITLSAAIALDLLASVDPELLEQAIDNLVVNALQHCGPGTQIQITAQPALLEAERTPLVRIRVSDTGPGIPPEALPRLFERFYRVEAERADGSGRPTGFGLGLAIAREIVAAHGGTIAVESQAGQGTTFVIDLPVAAESRER